MRRVLVTLAITAGVTAALLAIVVLASGSALQQDAARFLEKAWSPMPLDAWDDTSPAYAKRSSARHFQHLLRYYDATLGAYQEIEGVVSEEKDGANRRATLVLDVRFEKVTTKGTLVFDDTQSGWKLRSFEFEVPPELVPAPAWEHVEAVGKETIEKWATGEIAELYYSLSDAMKSRMSLLEFEMYGNERRSGFSGLLETEQVLREEDPDAKQLRVRWKLGFPEGDLVADVVYRWEHATGVVQSLEFTRPD